MTTQYYTFDDKRGLRESAPFVTCPTCHGRGLIPWLKILRWSFGLRECPTCDCLGQVPPPQIEIYGESFEIERR